MGIVVPGPAWYKAEPIAVSDTVDNVGGPGNNRAVGIHNRSAAAILAHILGEGEDATVSVHRISPGDTLMWGHRWKRVMATGTTGGGTSGVAYETIHTTGNGAAFTNQPANDGVEVLSSSAADTTQTATVYGTTQGTDTVVAETIALNGTTPVASVKTDWGVILGVELSGVCAGTVTVREASADQTIVTLATTVLSAGVETVTNTDGYNVAPIVVASGTTTKQIGLYGTAPAGTAQGDSQALTNTTALAVNLGFGSVTKILTGNLEATRTVTVSASADLLAYY